VTDNPSSWGNYVTADNKAAFGAEADTTDLHADMLPGTFGPFSDSRTTR
jgi:hypothetical protein